MTTAPPPAPEPVPAAVGNDVVDLQDPQNQPEAIHPRFDLRVFGEDERAVLAAQPDPLARHRARWSLWAAKEAAFKALARGNPGLPFHPRRFAVAVDRPRAAASRGGWTSAAVRHAAGELVVRFDVTPARVHAVASGPGAPGPRAGVARISAPTSDSTRGASAEVRRLAQRDVAALLGITAEQVRITGGGGGYRGTGTPRAVREEAPRAVGGTGAARPAGAAGAAHGVTPLPVVPSLSHDGRWVGWALARAPA